MVELYREGATKLFHQMEVNGMFILFYIWQMRENTLCPMCLHSIFFPRNGWVIFRCLELLKIHKSSFKNSLKLLFHQNISQTIRKVQILTNFQKSPRGFCHPLRLLCTAKFASMRSSLIIPASKLSSMQVLHFVPLYKAKTQTRVSME